MEKIQPLYLVAMLIGGLLGWLISAVVFSYKIGSWKREMELQVDQISKDLNAVDANCARKDLMDEIVGELRSSNTEIRRTQNAIFTRLDEMRSALGEIRGRLFKEG